MENVWRERLCAREDGYAYLFDMEATAECGRSMPVIRKSLPMG